jgi:hypothetical protein
MQVVFIEQLVSRSNGSFKLFKNVASYVARSNSVQTGCLL